MPRSQKSCVSVRRSAYSVGVWSLTPLNTRIRPDFSATNTRPSGAKRIAVGLVSPLQATLSLNPVGSAELVSVGTCGPVVKPSLGAPGSPPEAEAETARVRLAASVARKIPIRAARKSDRGTTRGYV